MGKMSKATRIRRMLAKGAPVSTIVKSLGTTPQYIYVVKSQMKKELKDRFATHLIINTKTGITPLPPEYITPKPLPEYLNSIQGEYSKHKEMTTWQRIKAALGF